MEIASNKNIKEGIGLYLEEKMFLYRFCEAKGNEKENRNKRKFSS